MLTSKTILVNLKRKFCDSTGLLTVESLCNEDNRNRCIEKMITATRNTKIKLHPSVKVASVLIPIVNCDKPTDEPQLLYTLRSNKMRKHISQVSFPGNNDANYGIEQFHNNCVAHVNCVDSFEQVEFWKNTTNHILIVP